MSVNLYPTAPVKISENPPRYRCEFGIEVDGERYDLVRNWPDDLTALVSQGKLAESDLMQSVQDQIIWAVRTELGV